MAKISAKNLWNQYGREILVIVLGGLILYYCFGVPPKEKEPTKIREGFPPEIKNPNAGQAEKGDVGDTGVGGGVLKPQPNVPPQRTQPKVFIKTEITGTNSAPVATGKNNVIGDRNKTESNNLAPLPSAEYSGDTIIETKINGPNSGPVATGEGNVIGNDNNITPLASPKTTVPNKE